MTFVDNNDIYMQGSILIWNLNKIYFKFSNMKKLFAEKKFTIIIWNEVVVFNKLHQNLNFKIKGYQIVNILLSTIINFSKHVETNFIRLPFAH